MRRRFPGTPGLPDGTMKNHGGAERGRATALSFLILLLLFTSEAAFSQAIELRVRASGNAVSAELAFQWEQKEKLLEFVKSGLGSRVEFLFRLQKKRRAIFPFLQETVVSETSLERSASFDIFSNEYSVASEREGKTFYTMPDEFLAHFFTVRDLVVFNGLQPGSSYAVAVQVRLTPIRLVPPLNIISLFGGMMAPYASPWIRQEVLP
jgi:hypothetical protein